MLARDRSRNPCRKRHAAVVRLRRGRPLVATVTFLGHADRRLVRQIERFAGKESISLIDGADLIAKIAALVPEKALALLKFATEGDFQTPTCPSCGIKMIERKSTAHGKPFWGCRNYPACKQNFFETL